MSAQVHTAGDELTEEVELAEQQDEEGWRSFDDDHGLSSMSAAQYRSMLDEEAKLRPVPIASVFYDRVVNPLSDDEPPEAERRRQIVQLLRDAFASSGMELKACRAERVQISRQAQRLLEIDDDRSRYYRDRGDDKVGRRNTVSPVERFESALNDLKSALSDCILCSEDQPPFGQLNISREFIRNLRNDNMPKWTRREVRWPILDEQRSEMTVLQAVEFLLRDCSSSAQSALSLGVEKPNKNQKGVTLNLLYYSFVVDLAEICRLGHVDIYDREGMPSATFLGLIERSEAILPTASRCGDDKRKRRRRVRSALMTI